MIETKLLLQFSGNQVLGWLARSPLKAPTTGISVAVTLGAVGSILLVLASAWDERSRNMVLLLTLLLGFILYVYQAFAAASVRNLETIAAMDKEVAMDIQSRASSQQAPFYQAAIGIVLALIFHLYFVLGAGRVPLTFSIVSVTLDGIFLILIAYSIDFMYRYWRVLGASARRVNIDLLGIDRYHRYANPLILTIGILAVFLCIILIAPALLEPVYESLFAPLLLIFVTIGGGLIIVWIWPVLVVRNRINDLKVQELQRIDQALSGNMSALSRSIIGTEGPLKKVELLHYQTYIRGLWTWPLHAYLQRLVIFGVLPPLSWIMAALLETVVQANL